MLVLAGAFQIQRTISESEKTSENTNDPERPWISVNDPVVASPLRFLPVGATVTLRFPVRHTGGRNPALNFSLRSELIPSSPERSAPAIERDRFVEQLKAMPDQLVFGERTLFQGDAVMVEQGFLIPREQVDRAAASLGGNGHSFLPFYVACAVYRLTRGGNRHYTCIVGDLHLANPGGLSMFFDITAAEIPASQIQSPQLYASYVD